MSCSDRGRCAPARAAALGGALAAAAVAVSWVEFLFPLPLPLPGIKLGLANAVTLFALFALGTIPAAAIAAVRCLVSALLFGGLMSLMYSLPGAMAAVFVMAAMKARCGKEFSIFGISIAGAAAFNLLQLVAASLITGEWGIMSWTAWMLPASAVTGAATGAAAGTALVRLGIPFSRKSGREGA